jgi:hypothetical protein
LTSQNVPNLAGALRGQFYLDEDAMREAVERHSSFNVVHLGTYFKADIFVAHDDEPSRLQMARSQRIRLSVDPPRDIVVASPEDVVAQKLYWYRLGDEVSERQWNDAIGVLKVAATGLDMAYLRRAAALLDVEQLLQRAIDEAIPSGTT